MCEYEEISSHTVKDIRVELLFVCIKTGNKNNRIDAASRTSIPAVPCHSKKLTQVLSSCLDLSLSAARQVTSRLCHQHVCFCGLFTSSTADAQL